MWKLTQDQQCSKVKQTQSFTWFDQFDLHPQEKKYLDDALSLKDYTLKALI